MIYLLLAIVCSSMIAIIMRLSEKHVRSTMVMFTTTYAVCTFTAFCFTGGPGTFVLGSGIEWAAALGFGSGFIYLGTLIFLQRSVHYNGVILSNAAKKLGSVLIPIIIAVVFFHDTMGWIKICGVIIAVAAIILINFEKKHTVSGGEESGELDREAGTELGSKRLLLVLLLLIAGVTDSMVNVYGRTGVADFSTHFLFFTFGTGMLIALSVSIIKKEKPVPADILWGIALGIPNYFPSRLLQLSLEEIPAVITYPVFSVGSIVISTVVGTLAFRERLTRQKMFAILLILISMALLNL